MTRFRVSSTICIPMSYCLPALNLIDRLHRTGRHAVSNYELFLPFCFQRDLGICSRLVHRETVRPTTNNDKVYNGVSRAEFAVSVFSHRKKMDAL
jgi:hypothetical protein